MNASTGHMRRRGAPGDIGLRCCYGLRADEHAHLQGSQNSIPLPSSLRGAFASWLGSLAAASPC